MSDILFVIKTFVVTIVLVILLQVRVGTGTIEQHSQEWIRTSPLIEMFRGVADGGVKAMTQSYRSVAQMIDTNVSKKFSRESAPGSRLQSMGLKRSDAVVKSQETKAAQAMDVNSAAVSAASQLEEEFAEQASTGPSASNTDRSVEKKSMDGRAPAEARGSEKPSWVRSAH